jgi:23S rRNA (uracil1939-C5)-methyltransferase
MIELELTSIAHGGDAVGHDNGKAVFVPYAIPGEVVRVEIVQDKGRYARARLVQVVRPSPDRVEPRCPHAPPQGKCGGCQWQHIAYQAQLRLKAEIVREQLQRLGGLADPPVAPVVPSPSPWMYRNHVEFSTTPDGQLGFFDTSGQRVTPIAECHIIEPALADVFDALDFEMPELIRLSLRKGSAGDDVMLAFETEDDEAPELETDLPLSASLLTEDGETIPLLGNTSIQFEISNLEFQISPASFFQVNTAQAETLARLVTEFLDLKGGESVLDAYCGAGLFTAAIVAQAGRVVGIEASPSACADFQRNLAGAQNVSLHQGEVGQVLPALPDRFDAIVLDPPRGGCEPGALDALVAKAPRRIVFVSCDPATLARDIKRLTGAGYQVQRVQPVDMFPQTYHIETVVELILPQV